MPIQFIDCANYERLVASAHLQLGEKAFATAWAEGREMAPSPSVTDWLDIYIAFLDLARIH